MGPFGGAQGVHRVGGHDPGGHADAGCAAVVRHAHFQRGIIAKDHDAAPIRALDAHRFGRSVERDARRLAQHFGALAGHRGDHRVDRKAGADAAPGGGGEKRHVAGRGQDRAVPHAAARRLKIGKHEFAVPAGIDRLYPLGGLGRAETGDPGIDQRRGNARIAQHPHAADALGHEPRCGRARRGHHFRVFQIKPGAAQRCGIGRRRLGGAIGEDAKGNALALDRAQQRDRAGQRAMAAAGRIAKGNRAVHVKDEAAGGMENVGKAWGQSSAPECSASLRPGRSITMSRAWGRAASSRSRRRNGATSGV